MIAIVLLLALNGVWPIYLVTGSRQTQAKPGLPAAAKDESTKPKPPSGVIRGRVVAAETGGPLARAVVVLSGGEKDSRATSTDVDGRYEFTRLTAARYSLSASKPRFATLRYGQRRTNDAGKPVDLADAQVLEGIDIALLKGAVIAGTVFDEHGEPAEYVRVAAMRTQYLDGRRQLLPAGSTVRTDDLGRYRIAGLPPGSYIVGTATPVADSVPRPVAGRAYGASYYPGASGAGDARPIVLDAGQERLDADFGLVVARPAKISGMALDGRGRPAAGASVSVLQLNERGGGFVPSSARVQPDGKFTLEKLAPGDYAIVLDREDAATGIEQSATVNVTVGATDIDNLVLTAVPKVRVSGRVRFEASQPALFSPEDLRVYLPWSPDTPVSSNSSMVIRSDWSFELRNVSAGRSRFAIAGLPPGWGLKAVRHAGRDVTDTPLNIRQDMTGMEIVLTDRLTHVTGSATAGDGQALNDYFVIVFAEDASRWDNPRFLAVGRSDQNGRFSIRGLAPGNFLAIAVEDILGGDPNSPEYLDSLRSRATKVTLMEGETVSLDLKVVKG